jgi:hypothetical protein
MKTILTACLIVALPGMAIAGSDGSCTCRFKGGEVVEGETACIPTPNGMALALCARVLNNTSWKMLNQPCPQASVIPQQLRSLPDDESLEKPAGLAVTDRG